MKKLLALLLVAAVAGGWLYWRGRQPSDPADGYRFVSVERGDLERVVSATGALEALNTVEVGTQVSGQIAEIYVDFNDTVERGQLIARIDPTLLEQTVRESRASLERNRVELVRSERDFARARQLSESGLLAESDLNTAQYDAESARASLASAEAALARAEQNLAYTAIYSPIDGVVIERNVDVGQTVAASLSAPQLFLIAEDLSKMEILVSVDESDIGLITEGQPVRFVVQAYPDDTFTGAVRQVRLQSTTVENVVNYSAVVGVANDGGRLLPGMTATVEFLIDTARDVLYVSNAALRFRPSEEMLAALREGWQRERGSAGDDGPAAEAEGGGAGDDPEPRRPRRREGGPGDDGAVGRGTGGRFGGRGLGAGGAEGGSGAGLGDRPGGGRPERAVLWILGHSGDPLPVPVRTGISDGASTAVASPKIEEGMQIIAGITRPQGPSSSSSPFGGSNRGGGRRMPGGF